ncbi:MAG: hypothetical protein GWO39_07570, partial [Gammaproteobacteria bacterium]|nr:hypothetical protein [Gammaproteobacteria bacterium]NIV20578.1 hypothetical protein [Gammaproteobacteria bacterium]NIY32218.1 hypothetical protein [Gammaproteobacteria bacterium]
MPGIDVLTPCIGEPAAPWRTGMIVLATDHTTERDLARLLPAGEVACYVTRIA